jgi:alpha-2-macroglobulin
MTAQMHVVGKRHFGLKALPSGGGGGRRTTRELFDTLLLWKARVPLDAEGRATVEVPLNDSLTTFRIVAVATGGSETFGTGAVSIRTTQDLMILPGLAPLVREGDRYTAETTVRNTTGTSKTVLVTAKVDGIATALEPRTVALDPGAATVVSWDVSVPVGPSALRWEIEAAGGGLTDRVLATQSVVPAVPLRVYQATITQWEARPLEHTVERPAGAVAGRGGIDVSLRPTLVEGVDALRTFMRRYPYTCLEQRVSVAVALRDRSGWDTLSRAFPSHLDGDGLLKYFPGMFQGSDVLTSYVLAIAHEAGWPIDDATRARMTAGLANVVRGKIRRGSPVPSPDLTLRKLAAIEALSRYGAAQADMLSTVRIEPNLWPTSGVLDWWSVLRRLDVADRERRRDEAERIVRARLTLGGTTLGFSTERGDRFAWLMVSPDTNAVRLVLAILDAPGWKSDVPRIVRAAIGRQQRGAWDLTTSNAWGVLALEKFSAAFERDEVTGATAAALVGRRVALDWTASARGGRLSLPWPAGREDLRVTHDGTGRPWITVEANAAVPLAAPLEHGYRIVKSMAPIEQRQPGRWSRGDLVRVRIEIEAQNDMAWVVVEDPVPAGASHIGRGLGRESTLASQGEQQRGDAWIAYEERRFDRYRAYYAWVPKGKFVTEYTVRLNQAGRLGLPTTRVEALYAPETFAERPNAVVEVAP